jgi:hypothetical protein
VTRPVGGGQTGNGGAFPPPATRPPATVPPVEARVTPPSVLGRDLPEVRVTTPEVAVEPPAS